MSKQRQHPTVRKEPKDSDAVRQRVDPSSSLKLNPVWRFSDFDWEGPWGATTCLSHAGHIQEHIQKHLASFESMEWDEILKTSGAKKSGKGNNHHEIGRDKFTKAARERLAAKAIVTDTLFSLRLDQGTRIYGMKNGACLSIIFFDPHHKDPSRSAYDYS